MLAKLQRDQHARPGGANARRLPLVPSSLQTHMSVVSFLGDLEVGVRGTYLAMSVAVMNFPLDHDEKTSII